MNVLVTGGSGFIGRALAPALEKQGWHVRCAVRRAAAARDVEVGNMEEAIDWTPLLAGVDAVVHLAARVHDVHGSAGQIGAYRKMNVEASLRLAQSAARAGVKRLLFMSSVKVHGEGRDTPYHESDPPQPEDAYGLSKWEAEQALQRLAGETGMELVVLRPPLVYGPGAGANMRRMLRLAHSGLPLPFGSIHNRRSVVYIDNLTEAVRLCLEHPAAVGKTFLLSDGTPVSAPQMLHCLARAMGRQARLFTFPPAWLGATLRLAGRARDWQRLAGSLTVDDSAIRHTLGWTPEVSVEEGLGRTARWYQQYGI